MQGTQFKSELSSQQTWSSLPIWADLISQPFYYFFLGLSEVKVVSAAVESASCQGCAEQPIRFWLTSSRALQSKIKLTLKVGHGQTICHESLTSLCLAVFIHKKDVIKL